MTISLGDRDWYVRNYEGSNLGSIDLTSATVYSDNTVYAQLTQLVQPKSVVKVAHRLGIASPLKSYFAIGLGGRGRQPAGDGARVRVVRERREVGSKARSSETARASSSP